MSKLMKLKWTGDEYYKDKEVANRSFRPGTTFDIKEEAGKKLLKIKGFKRVDSDATDTTDKPKRSEGNK